MVLCSASQLSFRRTDGATRKTKINFSGVVLLCIWKISLRSQWKFPGFSRMPVHFDSTKFARWNRCCERVTMKMALSEIPFIGTFLKSGRLRYNSKPFVGSTFTLTVYQWKLTFSCWNCLTMDIASPLYCITVPVVCWTASLLPPQSSFSLFSSGSRSKPYTKPSAGSAAIVHLSDMRDHQEDSLAKSIVFVRWSDERRDRSALWCSAGSFLRPNIEKILRKTSQKRGDSVFLFLSKVLLSILPISATLTRSNIFPIATALKTVLLLRLPQLAFAVLLNVRLLNHLTVSSAFRC